MASTTTAPAKKTAKKVAQPKKPAAKKSAGKKTPVQKMLDSYDKFKTYKGQQYTGMPIGKSHKWYYDQGVWKERKITPDRWEISYSVVKRRAGKAPKGTGAPVGTGYHWFILSHQFVHKLNEDDYTTAMTGIKLKLAHKRAGKDKWNITEETKRKHLIEILEKFVAELKEEPSKLEIVQLDFDYKEKHYNGFAVPLPDSCVNGTCRELDVTLNNEHLGMIRCTEKGWRMTNVKPQSFVNAIGHEIFIWYE